MADIINLNRYRKEHERDAKAKTAEENRVRHGRTKEEKARERDEARKTEKALDDKKIE